MTIAPVETVSVDELTAIVGDMDDLRCEVVDLHGRTCGAPATWLVFCVRCDHSAYACNRHREFYVEEVDDPGQAWWSCICGAGPEALEWRPL